jgi:hypothetical protein
VPANATDLIIRAKAIDLGGNLGTSNPVNVRAIPDPLTTAMGRVLRQGTLAAVAGADVTCLDRTTTSSVDGSFTIADMPTIQGNITCRVSFVENGKTLRGFSQPIAPVPAGITVVGDILIREGSRILLLSDVLTSGTTALADALTTQGNEVVVRPPPEFSWDGTNPPLTGFGCVVHLDGTTYAQPLPPSGQQALVDFVKAGGGYIAAQWLGYERTVGITIGMNDLILFGWGGADGGENCGDCSTTYVKVAAQAAHPVLEGIPDNFTFLADANSAGQLFPFAGTQPVVLMTQVNSGRPAVVVRQVDAGRVVQFSIAPNYFSNGEILQHPNIQKLYANAAAWGCR